MPDCKVSIDHGVTPEEVIAVREEESSKERLRVWKKCLDQALCVVSARDSSGRLVGIGFLVGNQRHGEIVDLTVHGSVRRHGIGGSIFDLLTGFARRERIIYLGLTYDTSQPWLRGFYERHGFRPIDFAMWHEDSLIEVSE